MKILVYDDNLEFGGHQIMACRGIEALAAHHDHHVHVIYNPANRTLAGKLKHIPNIETHTVSDHLHHQFKALDPDTVLCIQGDTTQSIKGIEAAKKYRITCISYIAITHPMTLTGAKLGTMRDQVNQLRINRPDKYITISDSMKSMLLNRKTKIPIYVVHNGIPPPPIPKLRNPDSSKTLGVVGRIEFKQKQQDFMVRAFKEHPNSFRNCTLLFAGNGPDKQPLERMINDSETISLMPWQEDIELFYNRIDVLIIPSRYEGVPLVLLEALARGIPVIASATDGMKEILPQSWTFDSGSTTSLAWSFTEVQKSWQAQLEDLQQKIVNEYSLEQFNRNFVQAVTGN